MKQTIFFILSALILTFSSCQKKNSQGQLEGRKVTTSTRDTVSVVQLSKSPQADTMYVDLKILDPMGSKVFYKTLDKSNVKVAENGSVDPNLVPRVNSVEDIRDKRVISDQLSMLFLIDRSGSITPEDLSKQYDLIFNILNSDIKAKVYLSFMDNTITTSKLATKDNLKVEFAEEFTVKQGTQKYLYKAIMAKMEELSGETATCYPEVSHLSDLGDSTQKILFVLTDGKVDNTDGSPIVGSQVYT